MRTQPSVGLKTLAVTTLIAICPLGCTEKPSLAAVRKLATQELGCASSAITVVQVSVGPDDLEALYEAKGCGRSREYYVHGTVVKVHEGEFFMPH